MLNEGLKREVEKNLISLWDNYGIRYFENFFDQVHDKKKYEQVYREQAFLEKRALKLGFMREVQSQMNSNRILDRHRELIIGYIFIHISSLLKKSRLDSEATMKKLDDYLKRKYKRNRYRRRQVQTIIKEYYPEFFFQPDKKKRIRDDRQAVVSSVLIPKDIPFSPYNHDAVDYIQYDRTNLLEGHRRFGIVHFNAIALNILPEFLQGLGNFKEEYSKCLDHIDTTPEIKEYILSIITEDEKLPVFFKLYCDLNSIMALRWFKSRKSQGKEKLLEKEYPLKLNERDIRTAFELHSEIYGKVNLTSFMTVADLMVFEGMHKEASVIYEQILKTPELDPFVEAHCHDNIGITYRRLGNHKNTISHLRKALPYFKEEGDLYRQALILKNIAEANYKLDRKERCFRLYNEAGDLIDKGNDFGEKIGVLLNISISCERINEIRKAYEYLEKAQDIEIPDSRIDLLTMINQRLIDLSGRPIS